MFDRPHFYLTFGGSLFPLASGHEQWQTGVKFAADPAHDVSDFQGALEAISLVDILEDCTDLISTGAGGGALWSNIVTIDWAKVAIIGTNGAYAGAPKVEEQTGKGGGSGAFPIAPQLAAAVSVWSGDTFGHANRGRSYLPVPYNFQNTMTITEPRATAAAAAQLRDSYKNWLHQVAGEISTVGLPTFPAILSSLGNGTTKPIVYVSAGRVIDTMRSRRQALSEDPVWTAF